MFVWFQMEFCGSIFVAYNSEQRRMTMVDILEINTLTDELACSVLRFYGTEKNVNNGAVFVAMLNLLCFTLLERWPDETDEQIKERFDSVLAAAIKDQREFARTLPPRLTVVEGGRLN